MRNGLGSASAGVLRIHQGSQSAQKGFVVIFLYMVVVPEPGRANKRPIAVGTEPLWRRGVRGSASRMAEQCDGVALDAAALAVGLAASAASN